MIVTPEEIAEVSKLLEQLHEYWALSDDEADLRTPPAEPVFFANRPHLLMTLGYDNYRTFTYDPALPLKELPPVDAALAFDLECFYRHHASGAWHWFEGITDHCGLGEEAPGHAPWVRFWGPQDTRRYVPIEDWLRQLRRTEHAPDSLHRSLLLAPSWTPQRQLQQEVELASKLPEFVRDLNSQVPDLRSVHWRQLEELVAELLRSLGMQIQVTPRSHDGGRDIIARGELVPGEPLLVAVEVKQKAVIGIHDLQRSLWANRHFSSLMLATAGRFSSGVVKEAQIPENRYRLILKDGVALGQWVALHRRKLALGPRH